MKNTIATLLEILQDQKTSMGAKKQQLSDRLTELLTERISLARGCIKNFVPDLSSKTLKRILQELPNFVIPMVPGRFWGQNIDPTLTVEMLRIQLSTYMDNEGPSMEWSPSEWRPVVQCDQSIREIQETLIPDIIATISEIDDRIDALERLMKIDQSKMSPQLRAQIEEAVVAQIANIRTTPTRSSQSQRLAKPAYPSQEQISSNFGLDLLGAWLWYELLVPSSESFQELVSIESGDGNFGGAGANGDFSDSNVLDTLGPVIPAEVSFADVGNGSSIDQQMDLGAGDFS